MEDNIEVDFVINLHKLLDKKDEKAVEEEIGSIVKTARSEEKGKRILTKVILETCYLNDKQIERLCCMAARQGVDFVKTSTGFGTAGAKLEHVRLMKEASGLQVKAAGGIKNFEDAAEMIKAGATRLGTSSGVQIVKGFREGPLTRDSLAKMIDHTNLKPEASAEDIKNMCREAREHGFRSVCVRPDYAGNVAELLKGSGVKLCFVVGFQNLTHKDDGSLGFKRYDVPLKEKTMELRRGIREGRKRMV